MTAPRCSTRYGAESLTTSRCREKPLDVLAQQIVAEVALQEWNEDELLRALSARQPYRTLTRDEFNESC